MRLKSSNKKAFPFLIILGLVVFVLFLLKKTNEEKANKHLIVTKFEQKTSLDVIQIALTEKHYNKLKRKRNNALAVGILETNDTDYVPATITFNGVAYKAEIRLKGDWTEHLVGEKWSFRVKLKGDKTILGMRKFSLQHPKTRRYLNEWMYHYTVKREGLIGLRYGFVEGAIHIKKEKTSTYINKEVGIYAIEESFDKRTIESNKRKESVIIKFAEDYWWTAVRESNAIAKNYGLGEMDFIHIPPIDIAKYPITVFSESKVLEDSIMWNYFRISKNLLEDLRQKKLNISDVFDVKKLAMDNALMNLFGATHGAHLINTRYYYNPITSKLEPICFDGHSGVKLKEYADFYYKGKERDTLFLKEVALALNKVSQPSYIRALIKETREKHEYYRRNLITEFSGTFFNDENLMYNQVIMRKEALKLKKELKLSDIDFPITSKKEFIAPSFAKINAWLKEGVKIDNTKLIFRNKEVLEISRIDKQSSAFIKISNIEANYGEYYTVSINVKKTDKSSQFALRLISKYPNRIDAVFNIDKGSLKGVTSTGYFEDASATITPLKNGWYKCTIKVQPNHEKLNILFGPTNDEKNVVGWEGKTEEMSSVYIVPSSLTVEEVSQ